MIATLRICATVLLACVLIGCRGIKTYELAGATPADQRSTVEVPAMLDALTLDGNDAPRNLASTAPWYRLVVSPGAHELVLRYSGSSDDQDPARREIVRSPTRKLAFTTAPGATYRLGYRVPQVLAARGETLRELDVWIEPAAPLANPGPAASAPAPSPTPVTTPVTAPTPPAPTNQTDAATSLDTLKQQWEQATPEERDAFWKWQGTR